MIGLLLLAFAAWAWRRGGREPTGTLEDASHVGGRLAEWSDRATRSPKWAFVLGLVMFLPSPLYLLAVKNIADGGDSTSSQVVAVLVCGIPVMVFVEVPLAAMFVRPGGIAAALDRLHGWLGRNGWRMTAGLAFLAAIYAIRKGVDALG